MSDELSFTESLRLNGVTKTNQSTEPVETNDISMENSTEEKKEVNENTSDEEITQVFIGSKSLMSYVLTIVSIFNNDEIRKISIKARGRAINKAVDVSEVVRHRFITDLNVDDINIGTERLTKADGNETNVSTMEIILYK